MDIHSQNPYENPQFAPKTKLPINVYTPRSNILTATACRDVDEDTCLTSKLPISHFVSDKDVDDWADEIFDLEVIEDTGWGIH